MEMKLGASLLLLTSLVFPISSFNDLQTDLELKANDHPNQVGEDLDYLHLNNYNLENHSITFEVKNRSDKKIAFYAKVSVAKTNRFGKIVYDNAKATFPSNNLKYNVEKNLKIIEPYQEIPAHGSVQVEVKVSESVKDLEGIAMGSFSIYQVEPQSTHRRLDKTKMERLPFVLTTRLDDKLETSDALVVENLIHDVAYGNMVLRYELNNMEAKLLNNLNYKITWKNLQNDEVKEFKRKHQQVAPNGGIHQYVNLGNDHLDAGNYGVSIYIYGDEMSWEHYEEVSVSMDESLRLNQEIKKMPKLNKGTLYLAGMVFAFSLFQYIRITLKHKKRA
ncbi:WxL protein peptidoglycan domain-containing protein [Erysipelothrix urinaevulpis]